MTDIVGAARSTGDEQALALFRQLATSVKSASEVASALFDLIACHDHVGEILAEAAHAAAEATTDGDIEQAVPRWLELLRRFDMDIVTSSGDVHIDSEWDVTGLPPIITDRMKVPAASAP